MRVDKYFSARVALLKYLHTQSLSHQINAFVRAEPNKQIWLQHHKLRSQKFEKQSFDHRWKMRKRYR